MKFRNYCLIVMGKDIISVIPEIEKVSESEPNILNANGIIIATFCSVSTPPELTEWFKLNERSFVIFDLTPSVSGFNITKPEIHEGLFGFLKTFNLEEKSEELFREIKLSSETKSFKAKLKTPPLPKKLTKDDIKKMSKDDKQALVNKIIDNGVENMTDDDKLILQFIYE